MSFNPSHFTPYLSEKGTQELAEAVRAYRDTYGPKWLAEFKANMPHLCEVIDLCANYDFPAALVQLQNTVDAFIDSDPEQNRFLASAAKIVAGGFIRSRQSDLERLHKAVKYEIDRPR